MQDREKVTETNVQESAKCLDLLKEESKLDLKIEDTVTEDVTHYVAKGSEDKVVEKGDLSYYLALVGGKWIVSFKCECSDNRIIVTPLTSDITSYYRVTHLAG